MLAISGRLPQHFQSKITKVLESMKHPFTANRKGHGVFQNACLALLLACCASNALAGVADHAIAEVQTIEINEEPTANGIRLAFTAYGQSFNLLLQQNDALMKNYSASLLEVELFAGVIEGVDDSCCLLYTSPSPRDRG